jgi:nitrate/nitrite-specific signal transduction histidine kinase
MLLIGVAAILFSFLTAFFLSRWIVKPIKLLASASMKIANGELAAFDNLRIKMVMKSANWHNPSIG